MRWLIRIFGVLILLVVVAFVGLLMLPGDRIAQVAVDQIEAQTGRQVTLRGETKLSYYPVLGVATGGLEVAGAEWSDTGPLLSADSLKVGVDFMSLIAGDIRITGLEAVNPQILLERAADGRANWEIGVDGVAPSGQSGEVQAGSGNALSLTLDRALVSGGSVRYLDHQSGTDVGLTDVSADLRWPDVAGAADFDISARLNGAAPVTLSGQVADLAALIEGEASELRVAVQASGGSVDFDGQFQTPAIVAGAVGVKLRNTADFLAALGVTGVSLPEGAGRSISGRTDLSFDKAQMLKAQNLTLSLDKNTINGTVSVDLSGTVPFVRGTLEAGALVAPVAVENTAQTSGGSDAAPSGWSKESIDLSALSSVNADVSLQAGSVTVGDITTGAVDVRATLDRARLVLALNQVNAYDGVLRGQFVANNRSGLSVGGDVSMAGVDMQSVLRDFAGTERFTGQAEASLKFLAVGNSMHAIMNSIKGDGRLNMGRGTIQGIDLDRLMRGEASGGGTTVFDALNATFTLQDGNLFNKDLLMQLPVVSVSGEGRVGLGPQDIDYLLTPRTTTTEREISIPVRIRGPWAGPKVWPDLEHAINLNLQKEKAEAEAKVKAKVEDRVKKELGIEQNEGESLEDAAKRTIENELMKGLGKIFQ